VNDNRVSHERAAIELRFCGIVPGSGLDNPLDAPVQKKKLNLEYDLYINKATQKYFFFVFFGVSILAV